MIDLRSDTVTQPTPEMREAMARAEVGDDVWNEDPTIHRLEEMSASRMGQEAGLFVASGTMGNIAALLAHCGRGDEIILGGRSHTFVFEQGGVAALGGIMPHVVPNREDGTMALDEVEAAIRPDDVHQPRTRAVCFENTHNMCNGSPIPVDYTARLVALARGRGLRVHLDGARIFNAAAALGVEPRALAGPVDSVTFCLSKGLCAPVGSVLCGSRAFIAEARRARKILGGGMRQAGVLAAAGIVALETIAPRVGEDNARAAGLAAGLARIPGVKVAPARTNILFFTIDDRLGITTATMLAKLRERGVRLMGGLQGRYRAVTHHWITDADVETTVAAVREIVKAS